MNLTTRFNTLSAAAILAAALSLAAAGCQSGAAGRANALNPGDAAALDTASRAPIDADSATMVVHGLGCPLCAHNIDGQLKGIRGVRDAEVDLGTGNVRVTFADGAPRPSAADLAGAVSRSGFTLVRIVTP